MGQVSSQIIYVDSAMSQTIKVCINPNGDTVKTIFSENILFTLLNDTLHGDCFYFDDNGSVEKHVEFNHGRLWNIYHIEDSLGVVLNPGTIKDGNGLENLYLLNYNELLRTVQQTNKLIGVRVIKDGVVNGYTKYFDEIGDTLFTFYECSLNKSGYSIDTMRQIDVFTGEHSNTAYLYHYCVSARKDTTFYFLRFGIVYGYETVGQFAPITLPIEKMFVHYEYATRKNLRMLKILKKKLLQYQKKHNGEVCLYCIPQAGKYILKTNYEAGGAKLPKRWNRKYYN
jgi:antitoxin component YwqK of YwqJK toxin-antitoxin module